MTPSLINKNRIWEIDLIRGIAIVLMILFHLIVDLKDFYNYDVSYLNGFWYIEGKFSAILFILICGVSSTLSHRNHRHGLKIMMWAMFLTVGTYFFNGNCYILFGILHFLGISLLSANFCKGLPMIWLSMISGVSMILGNLFSQVFVSNPYLFPLGLTDSTFISLDYYPLFPWYGVFLAGMILGKVFYDRKRLPNSQLPSFFPVLLPSHPLVISTKFITLLGQHSLLVYLIHQPILLALLSLIHTII